MDPVIGGLGKTAMEKDIETRESARRIHRAGSIRRQCKMEVRTVNRLHESAQTSRRNGTPELKAQLWSQRGDTDGAQALSEVVLKQIQGHRPTPFLTAGPATQ